jgi:hypothetical protein
MGEKVQPAQSRSNRQTARGTPYGTSVSDRRAQELGTHDDTPAILAFNAVGGIDSILVASSTPVPGLSGRMANSLNIGPTGRGKEVTIAPAGATWNKP